MVSVFKITTLLDVEAAQLFILIFFNKKKTNQLFSLYTQIKVSTPSPPPRPSTYPPTLPHLILRERKTLLWRRK